MADTIPVTVLKRASVPIIAIIVFNATLSSCIRTSQCGVVVDGSCTSAFFIILANTAKALCLFMIFALYVSRYIHAQQELAMTDVLINNWMFMCTNLGWNIVFKIIAFPVAKNECCSRQFEGLQSFLSLTHFMASFVIPIYVMCSVAWLSTTAKQQRISRNWNEREIVVTLVQDSAPEEDNSPSDCSICLEALHGAGDKLPVVLLMNVCRHKFHQECVLGWIRLHVEAPLCPLCKRDFRR